MLWKIVSSSVDHSYSALLVFKDAESAELLLTMKLSFRGKALQIVQRGNSEPKKIAERYIEGATKIFIGAIPSKVTLEEFRVYFEQFGSLDDICLPMKSKIKGINRGHGFVNYVHPSSAEALMGEYKNHYLRDRWVSW